MWKELIEAPRDHYCITVQFCPSSSLEFKLYQQRRQSGWKRCRPIANLQDVAPLIYSLLHTRARTHTHTLLSMLVYLIPKWDSTIRDERHDLNCVYDILHRSNIIWNQNDKQNKQKIIAQSLRQCQHLFLFGPPLLPFSWRILYFF